MRTATLERPPAAAWSPRPRRPVTAADLARCCLRTTVKRRLKPGGTQIVQRCVEHPRLTCTRWAGPSRAPAVWCLWVDGRPVFDLAAAAAALNRPPL